MKIAKSSNNNISSIYVEFDNTAQYEYKCVTGLKRLSYLNGCYSLDLFSGTSRDAQMTCSLSTCGCNILNSNYCSDPIVYKTKYINIRNIDNSQSDDDFKALDKIETSIPYQINQRPSYFNKAFSMIEIPSNEDSGQLPLGITINLQSCLRRIYVPLNRHSSIKRSEYQDYFYIEFDIHFYNIIKAKYPNLAVFYDKNRSCISGKPSIDIDFLCLRANEIIGPKNETFYNPEDCINLQEKLFGEKCHSKTNEDSYERCSYTSPVSLEIFRRCLDGKYVPGNGKLFNNGAKAIELVRGIYELGMDTAPYAGPMNLYFSNIAFDYNSSQVEFEKKWQLENIGTNEKRAITLYLKMTKKIIKKYINKKQNLS